jgi:hypothetical protein
MATTFGFVVPGDQPGSFLGVRLGDCFYDRSGSYDLVWWLSIALGLIAALLHWPTEERASCSTFRRARKAIDGRRWKPTPAWSTTPC